MYPKNPLISQSYNLTGSNFKKNMQPLKKIKVVSDGNELEFQNIITPIKSGAKHIIYKYIKSKTKKGKDIGWTQEEYDKLILNKIIVGI